MRRVYDETEERSKATAVGIRFPGIAIISRIAKPSPLHLQQICSKTPVLVAVLTSQAGPSIPRALSREAGADSD
jgi:hypothetical protein